MHFTLDDAKIHFRISFAFEFSGKYLLKITWFSDTNSGKRKTRLSVRWTKHNNFGKYEIITSWLSTRG